MNGNIVGEEFEPYVFSEIAFRQSIQGKQSRDNTDLNYLSNQSSWIKLASPVFIEEGGQARLNNILANSSDVKKYKGLNLAKNAILFNGLSSYGKTNYTQRAGLITNNTRLWDTKSAYGLGGSDMGLQPMPGIIDAEVRCLNRGSIRKASVNIKAFNKFQFEIIELLYLRLGYTMMLEFGNQKYVTDEGTISEVGNTLIETFWWNESGTSQLEVLRKIEALREKYNGNYDGFFGKVVNFDWNFEEDGSYSIRIDLITLGDVIESLAANPSVRAYFPEIVKKGYDEEKLLDENLKDSPIVTNAQNDIISAWMYITLSQENYWKKQRGGENDINSNYYNLYIELQKLIASKGLTESNRGYGEFIEKDNGKYQIDTDKIPSKYSYYVTFSELLEQVKKYIIPNVKVKDGKEQPQLYIDNNVGNNFVNYFPNQISFDPRVCLIKPNLGGAQIEKIPIPDIFQNLKDYATVIPSENKGVVVAQLMNVYLNYDFISKCITSSTIGGKITLFKFLESICTGINTALGGVNQIEVIIDNDNFIKFIDRTPIPGLVESRPSPDIVDLEVFGYNNTNQTSNFVQGINFNTKITPDLASMITIGATAEAGTKVKNEDATAFAKWNAGLTDRFNLEITEPSSIINLSDEEQTIERYKQTALQIWEEAPQAYQNVFHAPNSDRNIIYGYNKSINNRRYKSTIAPGKKVIPNDVTFVKDKDVKDRVFTQNDWITYFVETKKEELRKNNAVDEFQYNNEITKNYAFYLSDAFGGDISFTVLYDEVKKSKIEDPEADWFSRNITLPIVNFFYTVKETSKTTGGSGEIKYITFDSAFIGRSNNIYKQYLNTFYSSKRKLDPTAPPAPLIGFIPISFDINLQGISGVKIYNKLNINQRFLPAQYPEALKFLITKVDHTISGNNWSTNLGTLSIPNISPDKYQAIWEKVGLEVEDYALLLPADQRGPKPKGNKFTILDNRAEKYRIGYVDTEENDEGIFGNVPPPVPLTLDQLISQFHPQFRDRFASFFNEMNSNYKGYTLTVNSIYRDLFDADELKDQNPANAAGGTSRHNYKTAIDFNITTPEGLTLRKSVGRNNWLNHGLDKLASKHKIKWGGNFDGYNDFVHFYVDDYSIELAFQKWQEQLLSTGEVDVDSINLT
jgi:hypothetical protein